jgi:NAD+ diphosphatase
MLQEPYGMSQPFVDELSAQVGFAGNPLNRLSEIRDDVSAVEALLRASEARTLVFAGEVPVLKAGDPLDPCFTLEETRAFGASREQVLLGIHEQGPVFATLFDADLATGEPLAISARSDLTLIDVRSLAVKRLLPRAELGMMAQAKSILHWHMKHRFCSNCGAASQVASAGWKRQCSACGAQHFPRTDPVVIMVATRGDSCLLGRQSRFAPGMYSALAGFIEPGETIEDAVRREVMEEAGVKIGRVTYMASQPWPFPASLMIGCIAEALSDDITIDRTELEDARWFTRDEVRQMLQGTHETYLAAPQLIAIARTLLQSWAM